MKNLFKNPFKAANIPTGNPGTGTSRGDEIPEWAALLMAKVASNLYERGNVVRGGAADGATTAASVLYSLSFAISSAVTDVLSTQSAERVCDICGDDFTESFSLDDGPDLHPVCDNCATMDLWSTDFKGSRHTPTNKNPKPKCP